MLFWSELNRRIAVEEETANLKAETARIEEEIIRINAEKDKALAESRELAQRLEIEDLRNRVERLEKIIANDRRSRRRRLRSNGR